MTRDRLFFLVQIARVFSCGAKSTRAPAGNKKTDKNEKHEISDHTDYLLLLKSERKWFFSVFSMLIKL